MRAGNLKAHQRAETIIVSAGQNILIRETKACQILLRQVDPPALGVLADITENIGELESHTEEDGIVSRSIAGADNLHRQQPNHRGDPVAVDPELLEGSVAAYSQVHRDPCQELVDEVLG